MNNFFRFFVFSFIVVMIGLWHGIAGGHVFPVRSEPKTGQTVHTSPPQVRIWFDGMLEPAFSTIAVQDSNGKKVDKGDGKVNASDSTILETNLPPLPPGTYHVIWNVVARDGHRTNGDFTFSIK